MLRRHPAGPTTPTLPADESAEETGVAPTPSAVATPGGNSRAHLPPPHLIALTDTSGRHQLWEGADQLTDDERVEEAGLMSRARDQAAAQLGLSDAERALVKVIHDRSDAQLAELALQAARDELPGPVGAMRKLAEAEVDALTAALGRERALLLRRTERTLYRSSLGDRTSEAAAAPVRSVGRRRLAFLRWTPSGTPPQGTPP
jgi:hypothetical protein